MSDIIYHYEKGKGWVASVVRERGPRNPGDPATTMDDICYTCHERFGDHYGYLCFRGGTLRWR